MTKIHIAYLVLAFFTSMLPLVAADVDECYEKYKNRIISETFFVHNEYLFVVGKAKLQSTSPSSLTMAQKRALISLESNIAKIKIHSSFHRNSNIKSSYLKNKIFDSWLTIANFRYTINNRIDIDEFSKDNFLYHVAAYKLSDINFEDTTPITWERIYNDFKNNPGKRNELLFFEIIPDHDMPALKDAVENNIAKQYGKNFALMFAGKDVPAITQKKYDSVKETYKNYNSQTAFKVLVIAANALPYDKKICTLLAEKFEAMQMPRCANIMRKRASESDKLVIEPEEEESQEEESQQQESQQQENKKSEDNQQSAFPPGVKNVVAQQDIKAEQTTEQDPQNTNLQQSNSDKKNSENGVENNNNKQSDKSSSDSTLNLLNLL